MEYRSALSKPTQNFQRDRCSCYQLRNTAVLIPSRFGEQIRAWTASWIGWYTYEDEPATGQTNTWILFIVRLYLDSRKHNIAHQTVVGACARTGVRKISTDARLTEGGLEGGENWCTTERGVHYSRGEGTCGALRGVEAMA